MVSIDANFETTDSTRKSFGDADGRVMVHSNELPWTPWALEGMSFKLLSINRRSGMWVCIIRIDPNVKTDLHYHFGDAIIFATKGSYRYEMDRVGTGEQNIEIGSIAHEPIFDERGAEVYVIFNGGLSGSNGERKPVGEYVNVEWMYEAAKANGAAEHLMPPPFVRASLVE